MIVLLDDQYLRFKFLSANAGRFRGIASYSIDGSEIILYQQVGSLFRIYLAQYS
jgi:hypothetical protein